jgi:hypothetical protein
MLGVTYKTAWFMSHRIREAMKDGPSAGPIGGKGKKLTPLSTKVPTGLSLNGSYRQTKNRESQHA